MSAATLYATILVSVGIAFCGGYMVCIGTDLTLDQVVSVPLICCGIFVVLAAGHLLGVVMLAARPATPSDAVTAPQPAEPLEPRRMTEAEMREVLAMQQTLR